MNNAICLCYVLILSFLFFDFIWNRVFSIEFYSTFDKLLLCIIIDGLIYIIDGLKLT